MLKLQYSTHEAYEANSVHSSFKSLPHAPVTSANNFVKETPTLVTSLHPDLIPPNPIESYQSNLGFKYQRTMWKRYNPCNGSTTFAR